MFVTENGVTTINSNVVLPKPQNTIKDLALQKLQQIGNMMITRKRDGNTAPILITGSKAGDVAVLTAGFANTTARYPHLVESLRALQMPAVSFPQGEVLLVNKLGTDDRYHLAKIAKSNPDKAVAMQAELGQVELVLFGLWSYGGVSMVEESYQARYDQLAELLDKNPVPHVSLVQELDMQLIDAEAQVRAKSWEGLVLYDRTAGSRISMTGSSTIPRPYGCWKRKPKREDDFVVTGFTISDAPSHLGAVKELTIAQYCQKTGKLVDCGKVGKGFSRQQRYDFLKLEYPRVAEITFEMRTDSGKLTHSVFDRWREPEEKLPEQCLLPAEYSN